MLGSFGWLIGLVVDQCSLVGCEVLSIVKVIVSGNMGCVAFVLMQG